MKEIVMFKSYKALPRVIASIILGFSAAVLIGGTFRSVDMPLMVYESVAALSFVIYTIVGSVVFKDLGVNVKIHPAKSDSLKSLFNFGC